MLFKPKKVKEYALDVKAHQGARITFRIVGGIYLADATDEQLLNEQNRLKEKFKPDSLNFQPIDGEDMNLFMAVDDEINYRLLKKDGVI